MDTCGSMAAIVPRWSNPDAPRWSSPISQSKNQRKTPKKGLQGPQISADGPLEHVRLPRFLVKLLLSFRLVILQISACLQILLDRSLPISQPATNGGTAFSWGHVQAGKLAGIVPSNQVVSACHSQVASVPLPTIFLFRELRRGRVCKILRRGQGF